MTDPVAELEREARRRHARWNPSLWRALLEGPAARLAEGLARVSAAEADRVLGSWLHLAAEGVGLGLLSTAEPAPNVSSLLMVHVAPSQLAKLPARARLSALAQAWNLGEWVEQQPGWVRALVLRLAVNTRLDALDELVAALDRALEPPDRRLGREVRVCWVPLASEDPCFLPGQVHFVSPTVCCVHDRLRAGDDGGVAVGVWLDEVPVVLGSTACREAAAADGTADAHLRAAALRTDVRVAEVTASAHTDYRGALVLDTSQFLLGLLPT